MAARHQASIQRALDPALMALAFPEADPSAAASSLCARSAVATRRTSLALAALRSSGVPAREATISNAETGEVLPHIQSFWFAWQAFYPHTGVWAPTRLRMVTSAELQLTGEIGEAYAIESSADYRHWVLVGTERLETGAESLPVRAPDASYRFWRARRVP